MRLYLVQHGEATDKEIDPARPLSEKGKTDVSKIAKFLKEKKLNVESIWHSTKRRAIQTAQILAESIIPKEGIIEKQGLAPNDPLDKLYQELTRENKDLMIVGHLPFLQKLSSLLLTNSENYKVIAFSPGGVICLEREDGGNWHLIWAITPELIK